MLAVIGLIHKSVNSPKWVIRELAWVSQEAVVKKRELGEGQASRPEAVCQLGHCAEQMLDFNSLLFENSLQVFEEQYTRLRAHASDRSAVGS
jgi:hypothetical protein